MSNQMISKSFPIEKMAYFTIFITFALQKSNII